MVLARMVTASSKYSQLRTSLSLGLPTCLSQPSTSIYSVPHDRTYNIIHVHVHSSILVYTTVYTVHVPIL